MKLRQLIITTLIILCTSTSWAMPPRFWGDIVAGGGIGSLPNLIASYGQLDASKTELISTSGTGGNMVITDTSCLQGNGTRRVITSVPPPESGKLVHTVIYKNEAWKNYVGSRTASGVGAAFIGTNGTGNIGGAVGAVSLNVIYDPTAPVVGNLYKIELEWDGATVTLTVNGVVRYSGAQSGAVGSTPIMLGSMSTNGTSTTPSSAKHISTQLYNGGTLQNDWQYLAGHPTFFPTASVVQDIVNGTVNTITDVGTSQWAINPFIPTDFAPLKFGYSNRENYIHIGSRDNPGYHTDGTRCQHPGNDYRSIKYAPALWSFGVDAASQDLATAYGATKISLKTEVYNTSDKIFNGDDGLVLFSSAQSVESKALIANEIDPSSQRVLNVFLVAGQSNTAGMVPVTSAPTWLQDGVIDGTVVWNGDTLVPWDVADYGPTGAGHSWVNNWSADNWSFTAIALRRMTEVLPNVCVVQVSQGGASIEPYDNATGGSFSTDTASIPVGTPDLMTAFQGRVAAFHSWAIGQGYTVNYRAVLWHQGEGDQNYADYYAANQAATMSAIRATSGNPNIPVALGTVSTASLRFNATVRQAQLDFAASDTNVFARDNGALTLLGDQLHFDANSSIAFGDWAAGVLYDVVD